MRGRLIVPFLAKLARLDTVATAANPLVAGYPSGYDDVFKEPIKLPDGTSGRREHPVEFVPCQVEVTSFEKLRQMAGGNDPDSSITLVFHFVDLEEMGLVDAEGSGMIRVGTRLISIHRDDQSLIQVCGRDSYYCIDAQPQSFGLSGAERNLLIATFDCRDNTGKNAGVG